MSLRLLDLPVEILEHILSPLLVQKQNPIALCPCGSSSYTSVSLYVRPLRILLIHPVIYDIAVRLFYGANTFLLDLDGDHVYHMSPLSRMRCAEEFPYRSFNCAVAYGPRKRRLLETKAAVRRIRRVDVSTYRPKYFENALLPLLEEMLLNGALTELHIRISHGFTRCTASEPCSLFYLLSIGDWKLYKSLCASLINNNKDTADARIRIFTLPPLMRLLTVMGNPKLLTSQLWIDPEADHWLLWEPFRMRPSVGACEAREEAVRSPYRGPVEIDWRSILRTIDPEAGDKAIMVS
ncbi:hypothetical protein E4U17_005457 [Claviceps sp. LM77 group G4]|nr:hypothetical protein E4U17_005457 [Claviceps sp. LM77 group G4]KAG6061705.1 hypothetical protein E4U33_006641 [Claviceps sp. LM78 group G4]